MLLHGVLDQESIQAAADGVRSGPFAELVSSETGDSFGTDVKDWQNYLIAWSRHITDFEPYWKAGSPPVSPLIEQHPDWFCRDSNGNVSGVYTKAFDVRNREWQDYFISAMSFLMTELDIDGFRFDAPTYNEFANWAPWARGRASTSQLACVGLFERLRPILKGIKSDALLYTEPSGHALRRSMDLNYNYDEQWLLTSLANPATAKPWGVWSGKGMATWMRDRDAVLPRGSLTAHHIDSHDTFWWPSWGKKWRREQFTLEQVRVLTVMFGGLPGPMMMFSGGEIGIEDVLPELAAVKPRRCLAARQSIVVVRRRYSGERFRNHTDSRCVRRFVGGQCRIRTGFVRADRRCSCKRGSDVCRPSECCQQPNRYRCQLGGGVHPRRLVKFFGRGNWRITYRRSPCASACSKRHNLWSSASVCVLETPQLVEFRIPGNNIRHERSLSTQLVGQNSAGGVLCFSCWFECELHTQLVAFCVSAARKQYSPRAEPEHTTCGPELRWWRFVLFVLVRVRVTHTTCGVLREAGTKRHKLWKLQSRSRRECRLTPSRRTLR